MIRNLLALISLSLVLLSQPLTARTAFAEDSIVLQDRSAAAELAFWNKIKDSSNISDLSTYLENFPNGMFYDVALEKYKGMGGNPTDLRSLASIDPNEEAVPTTPVVPKKIIKKTYTKKVDRKAGKRVVVKRVARPVCPSYKRLVGNSCRVVLKKVKVTKNAPVRVAKKITKKRPKPSVLPSGAGEGGSGGGGGAWN